MAVHTGEKNTIRSRVTGLLYITFIFYICLIAKLISLQLIHGDYYRAHSFNSRNKIIELPAQRGAILDRFGKSLALTLHTSRLYCDPTQVTNPQATADTLAPILGVSSDIIMPYLIPHEMQNGRIKRDILLVNSITPAIMEKLDTARKFKKTCNALNGISTVDIMHRAYPLGKEAVQLIGILKPDENNQMVGSMGLEKKLDSVLRGQDGFVEGEFDRHQILIAGTQVTRKDPQNGKNVQLTLDTNIQHIVDQELSACFQKYTPTGATAIVMDPHTGDVLAMASLPDFDPITRQGLEHSMEPMRNRALTLFEPGSTMKLITAAAALQTHTITPDTNFYCGGQLKVGNRTIRCVLHGPKEAHGHGIVNIRGIIRVSCNVGIAQVGMRLGWLNMEKYLESFGILSKTGIGLPGDAAGTLGTGYGAEHQSISKLARVAFGQSVMVSPLAMASAYAAIANHGLLMQPRLIEAYSDDNGNAVQQFKPTPVRQVVPAQLASMLTDDLIDVVENGTGKGSANIPGYTVAGKTGTAQKVVPGQRGYASGKYVASFIGFLPAHNPRAVIYVVVDEPHGSYYGAQVAAPVFQAIGRRLMWYWNIPPDNPASLLKPQIASTVH
jgi:stage V sporulation protein D (sporulation-specific penicillin-binding protein)